MIAKKSLITVVLSMCILIGSLYADNGQRVIENLSLDRALEIMKQENLELKISKFNEEMKEYEAKVAQGHNYGKADVIFQAIRSNSSGNVFGFKLESREANFGDFGAEEFMNNAGAAQNGDMAAAGRMYTDPPHRLNYPGARNHFQTKLSYQVPLYTGGKLDQYKKITNSLHIMSMLDTKKLMQEKIFQTQKTFYDISLVEDYIINLNNILKNIDKLGEIVFNMKEEGYAKNIDILEVRARKAEVQSMLTKAKFNEKLAYQYLSFLLNNKVKSIKTINSNVPMPKVIKEELQQNNLDIQKAKLGLKITDMAIKVQESNLLPEVGGFGEYSSADNTPFNKFFDKDSYTVGVQAKWNIYDGNINKNNLEKAKIENMKVQEQVNLAKEGILLQTRKIITQIASKDAEIQSLKTQLEFANKVYENYRERYKEGVSSISDVLIKQSKSIEVLLKLLTAKNDRNTKIFELKSIMNIEGEEI